MSLPPSLPLTLAPAPDRGNVAAVATSVLVLRQDFEVFHRALADDEAEAFSLAATGAPFAQLAEPLARDRGGPNRGDVEIAVQNDCSIPGWHAGRGAAPFDAPEKMHRRA